MTGSRNPLSRLKEGARAVAFGNPFYNLTLGGRAPSALSIIPPDPWPGDVGTGTLLIGGALHFAGEAHRIAPAKPDQHLGAVPWLPEGAAPAWVRAAHGFDWLRDLKAVSGDTARRQARLLVTDWIDHFGSWHPVTWAPELLGARIASWIGQHDFYCSSADDDFRARVFDSLARQCKHLSRVVPGTLRDSGLVVALKGLAYGGLCLPGLGKYFDEALALLEKELPRQILPDGGHIERCPSTQLLVLRHLIDLRAALRIARIDIPEELQHAIDRMTPALRFFRHGDGGLALFNGAQEEEPACIDTVLAQADARGKPLKSAPHTGFERMLAGRTLILMDTGVPPAEGLDAHAHAGLLSLELSVAKERLFVNCGAHPGNFGPWRTALAATAAHSTLTLAETNSSEVLNKGGLGRRPLAVTCERLEQDGSVLVEATHDGYLRPFGLIHRRRLYLAENGEDVRGEDSLEPPAAAVSSTSGHPFIVRFHLHPAVQASLLREGHAVLLRLASGVAWRLRASGCDIDLVESVYLGVGDEARRSLQVTLSAYTQDGPTLVKWALRREKKGA
ncbi:MAG TPA: heparinase II/III family protein [Azospirillaceae bacterium]|nr:heparinase II/III family protein [Azospirillaceae bacterium]